jgi:hypothetical protein
MNLQCDDGAFTAMIASRCNVAVAGRCAPRDSGRFHAFFTLL